MQSIGFSCDTVIVICIQLFPWAGCEHYKITIMNSRIHGLLCSFFYMLYTVLYTYCLTCLALCCRFCRVYILSAHPASLTIFQSKHLFLLTVINHWMLRRRVHWILSGRFYLMLSVRFYLMLRRRVHWILSGRFFLILSGRFYLMLSGRFYLM